MKNTSKNSRRDFLKGAALASGVAALGSCTIAPSASTATRPVTHTEIPTIYPRHNERTKGWLKFLWQKATTPDDWSIDGQPHEWWDQYSTAPYFSYPRFDLSDSSYAILLMADQTPAWREVYTRIMDELATRHTAYWAAIDWNTFIGPSPDRKNYTQAQMAGWPDRVKGNYDFPGWTGNGLEPWGLQADPIGADGNLFFRGWLNLVLSIYKYVSGDEKWEQSWNVAGYENQQFQWTQPRLVEHLASQYSNHPEGPHCENTKIWPICNSAAGLGMYLSDQLSGRSQHGVFENWVEFMKDNYMGFSNNNELEWMTLFYDPVENFKINIPGGGPAAGSTAFYLLPQSPEIATFLYDTAANAAGWRDPKRAIRPDTQGLIMAKALGDHTAISRLSAAAEQYGEPRHFGDDNENFAWWFNIDEPYPRGQGSAQMMISEIQQGSWTEAFQIKHMDKYRAPTLEGIDFPGLGVDQAWNDKESGILHVGTYAAERSKQGQETSWQVSRLPNSNEVFVLSDGQNFQNFEITGPNSINIHTDINNHRFQIYTGYHGQQFEVNKQQQSLSAELASSGSLAARTRTQAELARSATSVMNSAVTKCPCCATG